MVQSKLYKRSYHGEVVGLFLTFFLSSWAADVVEEPLCDLETPS